MALAACAQDAPSGASGSATPGTSGADGSGSGTGTSGASSPSGAATAQGTPATAAQMRSRATVPVLCYHQVRPWTGDDTEYNRSMLIIPP